MLPIQFSPQFPPQLEISRTIRSVFNYEVIDITTICGQFDAEKKSGSN